MNTLTHAETLDALGTADFAIARELGQRIARHRLNRNTTQQALADAIGVSKPTIVQLEQGNAKLLTLIAALRELGLIDQAVNLIHPPPISPNQLALLQGNARQRARGGIRPKKNSGDLSW